MRRLLILTLVVLGYVGPNFAQTLSSQDRDRALIMLKAAREDIQKNYYDPNLRGIDLEALSRRTVDEAVNKAKKCKTLILDLRRNQGGAVDTLKDLVGNQALKTCAPERTWCLRAQSQRPAAISIRWRPANSPLSDGNHRSRRQFLK